MSSKVENKLAILSYHEKRIQLEHEVQQRYENLSEEAQAVIRDTIREFIRRSAMPVRIIYAQKFGEELENTLFEKNQAFKKLSDIHARALTAHNDQLDYTWKEGHKTGVQDANAAHQAMNVCSGQSPVICVDKVDAETKQELLKAMKGNSRIIAMGGDKTDVETTQNPISIQGTLVSTLNEGFLVRNWRDSKKWISNWCFGLIAFLAVTPIPPEVLAVLPENVRYYLIAFTAFCGFLGRYINQTKPVPLPLIGVGDADV